MEQKDTILIIGAGGFIGGFIAAEAIRRGYDTWVGVRSSTSRKYLTDPALRFIEFEYDDKEAIAEALKANAPEAGKWKHIIWNLGATKCANFRDFNHINYLYLKNFVEVLIETDMVPERFLFMSSLSALGTYDDINYTKATSKTIPHPNTRYGLSKIKAETFLEMLTGFPWIIFRPTGVYGPHEQDYLMMIKSIDSHFDFGVGYKKQLLTFIYVEDLVNAQYDALKAGVVNKKYIISEPKAYTQKEFRDMVAEKLGKKVVIPLKLPLPVVYVASYVAEKWAAARLKASTLNRDKFKIMRQRNWDCDVTDAQRDFGFSVKYPLSAGLDATIKAYLDSKSNHNA